ncbi:MAG: efflux RND transporter permease subunit, partial [Pseudomonadota bacterium]
MWDILLRNHVLANLTFVLVLVVGLLSYQLLPRQQDPTINFNWIVITTILPGAAALDVEQKVTDPLEDAVRKVQDIKFLSS